MTRIGDEVVERPVYRDPLGITAYGGILGRNYEFVAPTGFTYEIIFQTNGGAQPKVNGLTNEILLGVLIDRLTIQNKILSCRENERALDNLKDALNFLEARASQRVVELSQ